MTAATSWPWNRTLSVARTAWVSPERVGIHARLWAARSAPVTTATTPGSAAAAEVSMDAMRAWGTGLRRTAACSIPGRTTSSTKRPAPRRKRSSSLRRSECPMPPIPGGVAWVVGCSVVVIVRALLALGGGGRRGGMLRRPAHRLHDVHVARAAAQVPGDGPADLVLAGVGVAVEQRPADQHHRRRAEPALQAVALPEALLDGVELAVARQALDGGDRPAVGLHREQRAGLHRRAVEQHRAHPAARGVAPDMGAGEAQVGPDEVGQEHPGLDVVVALDTVDGDRDLHGRPPLQSAVVLPASSAARASPRRTNTRTMWRLYSADPRTSLRGLAARAAASAASANNSSPGCSPTSTCSASRAWTFEGPTEVSAMPASAILPSSTSNRVATATVA